jgi:hypothetical protein
VNHMLGYHEWLGAGWVPKFLLHVAHLRRHLLGESYDVLTSIQMSSIVVDVLIGVFDIKWTPSLLPTGSNKCYLIEPITGQEEIS